MIEKKDIADLAEKLLPSIILRYKDDPRTTMKRDVELAFFYADSFLIYKEEYLGIYPTPADPASGDAGPRPD